MSKPSPRFHLDIGPEISSAISRNLPVVALESTVITHGLPWPENVEVARLLEKTIRDNGAVPATLAILDGRLRVGLSDGEIETLAKSDDAQKLNLGNLAAGMVSGRPGSTTVGATMYIAHLAGISVFATGGIGGVHRGVADTMDISNDLVALSRIPVAVVSAGAKAILDLPKTVEFLETLGVPTYGWQTDEFPAFYRRKSGQRVDARFDDMDALAKAVSTHWSLGLESGIVVANPIPEQHELAEHVYTNAIAAALSGAEEADVTGRAVTPFLLDALRKASEGQSVFSNTRLLENNAALAARLAVALGKGNR
ncbi:MAG: pseudouridine-5'-phosphate glycosidase [Candidatus Sumerlaeia bacterium]|nr:pseudouridine-5'-phosphate glycosidase [Candidatus Sumerlaeia bacterium]